MTIFGGGGYMFQAYHMDVYYSFINIKFLHFRIIHIRPSMNSTIIVGQVTKIR